MAAMLIPGHNRDDLPTADEYEPDVDEARVAHLFIDLTDDSPIILGFDDAAVELDELAHDEWAAAQRDECALCIDGSACGAMVQTPHCPRVAS